VTEKDVPEKKDEAPKPRKGRATKDPTRRQRMQFRWPRRRTEKEKADGDKAKADKAKIEKPKAEKTKAKAAKASSPKTRGERLRFWSRGGKKTDKPKGKRKKSTTNLWFRVSTRFKAAGYWIREKAQAAGKHLSAAAAAVAAFWKGRSRSSKIRFAAVLGVLALWAVLKFTAVPGVPCSFSAVKECPPEDDTIALAPAGSLLYAHATLDGDTAQSERAADAFEQLPDLERAIVGSASSAVPSPSGAVVDLREDVLPWAEQDLAVTIVPGAAKAPPSEAFVVGVGDRAEAEEFITTIAPAGPAPAAEQQGKLALDVYADGFATAFVEDQLAFGGEPAVRAVLDAAAGTAPALDDAVEGDAIDDLSEARFAEVFLSPAGVQEFLAGRAGPAAQLETFVDYEATSGLAAALIAKEEGLEVQLVSKLDPKLAEKSPSFFSFLPTFEPDLASAVGSDAIGYVGVGRLGPTITELVGEAGPEAQGLAGELRALAKTLETDAGVNPLQELLPALGGQAALVADPAENRPFASLIVDGVDEEKASEALARLQVPVLEAAGAGAAGAQVPQFSEEEVDGVTVRSVPLSPAVTLSYALFDGRLVISTSPDGIAEARSGDDRLADSDAYQRTADQLPDTVSALVFLNLDELFGRIEAFGLAEDPTFAELTVLFENATSVGLAVDGEDDRIRTELFLDVD
jgi:hypothetical protein